MAEDLRGKIRWMEEALLSEEDREDVWQEDAASFPPEPGRVMFQDEDYSLPETGRSRKNANARGLRYLLFLEILGILAVIGWWLRWLI